MSVLISEIEERRKEIFTDSYPMSIGELVNLYRDGEIDINPSFQRFFRWSHSQKVSLIESILLGIPIPSIFVAQRESGIWDLVDGLQRVSTILSFMGELKDYDGNGIEPLVLKGTKYLPSLDGKVWEDKDNPEKEIDQAIRISFKREKIEIKIIKKESDANTKFELFQRLNTGGSELSDQEVRNCLLIMLDPQAYQNLFDLASNESFRDAISLTERLYEERYDMELILRLFALGIANPDEMKGIDEVSEFLTDSIANFTCDKFNWEVESKNVISCFEVINDVLGDNSFKKYDFTKGMFKGGFQLSVFEVVASGVYLYIKTNGGVDEKLKAIIKSCSIDLFRNPVFQKFSGSGVRANYRWPRFHSMIREIFLGEHKD